MLMLIGFSISSASSNSAIVAHLDALESKLDALQSHQAETAAELNSLLPAVLERAFRGEL
jgi:type I restriction enzyme S subunit